MSWLLRLFSEFRDLQALTASQSAQVEELDKALRDEICSGDDARSEVSRLTQALALENSRRIAAESIASERREEISRLVDQVMGLRTDLSRVNAERLRSVDALNVRLMREPVPEVAPDMEQYKTAEKDKGMSQVVAQARRNHHLMDRAILEKLHPAFRNRIVLNEPAPSAEEAVA